MIAQSSVFSLLLLLFKAQFLVSADSPAHMISKGRQTGNVKKGVNFQRRIKQEKKKSPKDSSATEITNIVNEANGDVQTNEFGTDILQLKDWCYATSGKKECDAMNECLWVDTKCVKNPPSCSSFLKQKACEQNGFLSDCVWKDNACNDSDIVDPSMSPTNVPVSAPTSVSSITTPTILHGGSRAPNCPPIGSRSSTTTKPSPKPIVFPQNNPVTSSPVNAYRAVPTPEPTHSPTHKPTKSPITIDPDTYSPTKIDTLSPVSFRRGELKKNISRLGIKGK